MPKGLPKNGKNSGWFKKGEMSEKMKGNKNGIGNKGNSGKSSWNKGIPNLAGTGERSHLWRGGITPLMSRIRHCFKSRQWRSDIFTRDDFTCVICGKRGGKINADHYPKSFASIFHKNSIKNFEEAIDCEEFWNINNGRTLCILCHKLTENYLTKYASNRT